jgi:hypothetical protein
MTSSGVAIIIASTISREPGCLSARPMIKRKRPPTAAIAAGNISVVRLPAELLMLPFDIDRVAMCL